MTYVYLWSIADEIEFPSFTLEYSGCRKFTVLLSTLMHHIKNCKLQFQNSELNIGHLKNSGINDNTWMERQPLLFRVNSNYLAVLIPTIETHKTSDGVIFKSCYSKMTIFHPQYCEIDLGVYNTMDFLMSYCVQLSEFDERVGVTYSKTLFEGIDTFQCALTSFISGSNKKYLVYIPQKQNSLIEFLKIRKIPEEYLLLLLNSGITKSEQLENLRSSELEFYHGLSRIPSSGTCCNLL